MFVVCSSDSLANVVIFHQIVEKSVRKTTTLHCETDQNRLWRSAVRLKKKDAAECCTQQAVIIKFYGLYCRFSLATYLKYKVLCFIRLSQPDRDRERVKSILIYSFLIDTSAFQSNYVNILMAMVARE